jgi:uncharacterized membrane protein
MKRTVALWLLALFFMAAGLNHFINPAPYLAMMPSYLPWPEGMNWISGAAEIAGGVGVLIGRTRPAARWGLIALLVAVFPANVNVALHGWPGQKIARWVLWARLPFQPVMIWAVYALTGERSGHGGKQ